MAKGSACAGGLPPGADRPPVILKHETPPVHTLDRKLLELPRPIGGRPHATGTGTVGGRAELRRATSGAACPVLLWDSPRPGFRPPFFISAGGEAGRRNADATRLPLAVSRRPADSTVS